MADIKINLIEPSAGPVAPSGLNVTSAAVPTPAPAPATPPLINIFSKQAEKETGPKMLESITGKESALKLKPILGNAPNLQKTLEQDKEYGLKKKLRNWQIMLVIVFMLGAGAAFYFYSELSPTFNLFGQNSTGQLISMNKGLQGLQAQLNKYRYLSAQIDLDRFSFTSDEFFDKTAQLNDPNTADAAKPELSSAVETAQLELPKMLQRIQDNLGADIVVKTYQTEYDPKLSDLEIQQQFEADLRQALKDDRAGQSTDPQKLKLIDNTVKLVGNTKLLAKMRGIAIADFKKQLDDYKIEQDPNKRKALQALITGILGSTKSDIATIGVIKTGRIEWTKIIDEIARVTKDPEVDQYFGQDLYSTVGIDLKYTGYEFDSTSGKIVLSGLTKTKNADNFTLISKLIDKLEESALFKNVGMRSFSKSGTLDTGYSANFKIDLELQTDSSGTPAKKISVIDDTLRRRVGQKRVMDIQGAF